MSGGHRAEFARLLVLSFDRRSHVTEDNVRKRHCAVDFFFSDSAPSPSAEEQVRPRPAACGLLQSAHSASSSRNPLMTSRLQLMQFLDGFFVDGRI